MSKWLPRCLLVAGIVSGAWAVIFPLHAAALQRAHCLAYERELRNSAVTESDNAVKYADTFAAAAGTLSDLSTTVLVITAILIIAGLVGMWAARGSRGH